MLSKGSSLVLPTLGRNKIKKVTKYSGICPRILSSVCGLFGRNGLRRTRTTRSSVTDFETMFGCNGPGAIIGGTITVLKCPINSYEHPFGCLYSRNIRTLTGMLGRGTSGKVGWL